MDDKNPTYEERVEQRRPGTEKFMEDFMKGAIQRKRERDEKEIDKSPDSAFSFDNKHEKTEYKKNNESKETDYVDKSPSPDEFGLKLEIMPVKINPDELQDSVFSFKKFENEKEKTEYIEKNSLRNPEPTPGKRFGFIIGDYLYTGHVNEIKDDECVMKVWKEIYNEKLERDFNVPKNDLLKDPLVSQTRVVEKRNIASSGVRPGGKRRKSRKSRKSKKSKRKSHRRRRRKTRKTKK